MAPSKKTHPHHNFIQKVKFASPTARVKYLRDAHEDQVRSICECVHNVITGVVPVKPRIVDRLKPYKHELIRLARQKGSSEKKRKLLIQKGGFLPILLGAILPVLGQLVANAFSQ